MKSLLTLCGWVVVGAVLAFGGQQVWKAYKANNPERSEVIAEKVTKTVETGADALRETADAVREEVATPDPEPVVEPDASATAPAVEPAPAVAKPTATVDVATPEAEAAPSREDTVEERFYAIASGDKPMEEEAAPTSTVSRETAAEYGRRQDAALRKEAVLIQRQMRIVDELTAK